MIFIHIPKTAGSSIQHVLMQLDPAAATKLEEVPACRDPRKSRHVFASDVRPYLEPDVWEGYFKFAFVRNPWDRMVSWWRMIAEREDRPELQSQFNRYVLERTDSFEGFLTEIENEGLGVRAYYNQLDYVCADDGSLMVDAVGRFEHLARDFRRVMKRAGIPQPVPPRVASLLPARAQNALARRIPGFLPHKNRTRRRPYREYYDERTRRIVGERFARDIEFFGYEF